MADSLADARDALRLLVSSLIAIDTLAPGRKRPKVMGERSNVEFQVIAKELREFDDRLRTAESVVRDLLAKLAKPGTPQVDFAGVSASSYVEAILIHARNRHLSIALWWCITNDPDTFTARLRSDVDWSARLADWWPRFEEENERVAEWSPMLTRIDQEFASLQSSVVAQINEVAKRPPAEADMSEKSRKSSKRRWTKDAQDVATRFKRRRMAGEPCSMEEIAREIANERCRSFEGLLRRMNDHPEKWKPKPQP